jgi:cytochrome c biogenesis protein CcmG/thiol:disulfide interchange protein DsbE
VKRWLVAIPLAVLAGLTLLFVGYALKHDPHVEPAALVGKPAPRIALAPLSGGAPVAVGRARPGAYLVNFFASWCLPCRQEHPVLLALKTQGVPVVGIAYRDTPDAAAVLLKTLNDPYVQVLSDPDGRAGVEYGISGVPETFVVGADGKVLAKHTGPLTPDAAEALAERLDQQ